MNTFYHSLAVFGWDYDVIMNGYVVCVCARASACTHMFLLSRNLEAENIIMEKKSTED